MIVRGDVGDISCSQVESLNYFGGTKGIVSKAGEKVRLPGWARLWEVLLSIGYVLASGERAATSSLELGCRSLLASVRRSKCEPRHSLRPR